MKGLDTCSVSCCTKLPVGWAARAATGSGLSSPASPTTVVVVVVVVTVVVVPSLALGGNEHSDESSQVRSRVDVSTLPSACRLEAASAAAGFSEAGG